MSDDPISKLFPSESFAPQFLAGVPFVRYISSPGVSKSVLDKFVRSPLDGYDALVLGRREEPTKAMLLGSLVDCAIFNRSDLSESYYIRPETYPDDSTKKWNGNSTSCRIWLAAHSSRPVITSAELQELTRMAEAVEAHPKAKSILRDVIPQPSFFARDPETGLLIKGRPDWSGEILVDLKCTNDAETGAFAKTLTNMRYPVQAGHYSRGLALCGTNIKAAYYIAVEGGDRPQVNVRKLEKVSFDAGKEQARRDLKALAECARTGIWPDLSGAGDEIGEIEASQWWINKVFNLDSLEAIEEVEHA